MKPSLLVLSCLALAGSLATAASAQTKSGINKDAMTMQDCRDRLATPAKARPRSNDPAVDKDAMCRNMLSASHRPAHAKPVARPARAASSSG